MSRRGFGAVELLIILAAVGLLAAVGGEEVAAWRERGVARTMRSDLLRFAAAQESYFYDHRVYAADVAALAPTGFQPSPGAQILVNEATLAGWSATASYRDTHLRCFLFVRAAAPVGSATVAGTVHCS
ncbi:MAG: type IV pilin protein [Gemmatimonadales bacterium]